MVVSILTVAMVNEDHSAWRLAQELVHLQPLSPARATPCVCFEMVRDLQLL